MTVGLFLEETEPNLIAVSGKYINLNGKLGHQVVNLYGFPSHLSYKKTYRNINRYPLSSISKGNVE